jgi:hypothetical protein
LKALAEQPSEALFFSFFLSLSFLLQAHDAASLFNQKQERHGLRALPEPLLEPGE